MISIHEFTLLFIVTVLVIVIGVDIWLATRKDSTATISSITRRAGYNNILIIMLICVITGLLLGHFFWSYLPPLDVLCKYCR